MVQEDFVRGGGVPLPCSTGGLPGGVASISSAWTGMASETYTHSREELKKKKRAQGIPCHSWSTATRSAAVSRVIYAALRVARRHLPPNRGRWQLLCLPTARGSARKKD